MIQKKNVILVLILLFYLQALSRLSGLLLPIKLLEQLLNWGLIPLLALNSIYNIIRNGIERSSLRYLTIVGVVVIASIFGTELFGTTTIMLSKLFISILVAYWIFQNFTEEELIEQCVNAQIVVIIIQLFCMTAMRGYSYWYYDGIVAFIGSFTHKNHISAEMAFMANVAILSLVYYTKNDTGKKIRNLFVILMSIYFMLHTDGMGGMLTFVLTFMISLLYFMDFFIKPNMGVIGSICGIGIYFISSFANNFPTLQQFMMEKLGRNLTFTGRLDIWNAVLEYVAKKPLTGYGYSTFWSMNTPISWRGSSHNGIFELLLQFGYVGTAFILIYFIVLFMQLKTIIAKRDVRKVGFEIVFLTFLMVYMISERSFQPLHYHTLFFALACMKICKEKSKIMWRDWGYTDDYQ